MTYTRIDGAVDVATIGIGERVTIVTKMGHRVDEGTVVVSSPFGIALNNGQYYGSKSYLYIPVVSEIKGVAVNALHDISPDEKTRRKLATMDLEESGVKDDVTGDKEEIKKKKDEKKDVETNDRGDGRASVEKLPDDIKKAIKTSYKMQDAQIESVLYDIAETAMNSLRQEHVPDGDIYNLVAMIRDAVSKVLKGKDIQRSKRG